MTWARVPVRTEDVASADICGLLRAHAGRIAEANRRRCPTGS